MNNQFLESLGIDPKLDLKSILQGLEDKQFEYLERLETANDENRKKEISDILKIVDEEITKVKEELSDVNYAVILDTPVTEAPGKKETVVIKKPVIEKKPVNEKKLEETEEKQKAKAITSKVKEIKNKVMHEEKEKKEKLKDQQEKKQSEALTKGLAEYKKQNYTVAFKIFKELSEGGDPTAQYMIALMYKDGQGVAKDKEREMFWLKKSADNGDVSAQLLYGSLLFSENKGEQKVIKSAFKYLGYAGDKGDKTAMNKYLDAVTKRLGGRREINKAMDFCDRLKAAIEDSFDKQQYDEKKEELRDLKKKGRTSSGKPNTSKRLPWVIAILAIAIGFFSIKYLQENGEGIIPPTEEPYVTEEVSPDPSPVEEVEEPVVIQDKVTITVEAANIREGAGTSFQIIGSGKLGDEFVATGQTRVADNGRVWYEIFLDESETTTGWASEKVATLGE